MATEQLTSIKTADGEARTWVWESDGPRVLVYIDGVGMRPAIRQVGARLADAGYHVVMPDLFYRMGEYEAPNVRAMLSDPVQWKAWWDRVVPISSVDNFMRDTAAYLEFIGASSERKIATTGYCMGGRVAFVAAANYPDQIAAVGAYHPGGLVTAKPDSPHLLAPKIKAKLFIGGAEDDEHFDDAAKDLLEQALTGAKVDHQIRTFPAKHGWVPTDTPAYDATQSEAHYETLLALLKSTIG